MNIEKHKKEDYPYIFRWSLFYVFYLFSIYISSIILVFYLIFIDKKLYYFGLIILLFCFLFIKEIKKTLKNKPLVKLNSKGIWTRKTDFIAWLEIKKITFYPSKIISDIFFYDEEMPNTLNIYLKDKSKISLNINGLNKKETLKKLINHYLDSDTYEKQKELNKNWKQFV